MLVGRPRKISVSPSLSVVRSGKLCRLGIVEGSTCRCRSKTKFAGEMRNGNCGGMLDADRSMPVAVSAPAQPPSAQHRADSLLDRRLVRRPWLAQLQSGLIPCHSPGRLTPELGSTTRGGPTAAACLRDHPCRWRSSRGAGPWGPDPCPVALGSLIVIAGRSDDAPVGLVHQNHSAAAGALPPGGSPRLAPFP